MKKHFWFVLALPLGFMACNNASDDSVAKADSANEAKTDRDTAATSSLVVDESTADFMVKAADVGMTEVEVGKVAQEKARSARVKEFAAMMVKDHTAAGDELKGLARQKNVTLPDSVGKDHRDMVNDVRKKSGADFDKAYMKMMVDGHENAVSMFEKCSNDTKNADVKSWVDKTLPALRMHLDSARSVQKSLK